MDVREPSKDNTRQKQIAAIVLAAGMSTRMGQLKLLLPFDGKPMLARVLETLLATQIISPIIVVTGHAKKEIESVVGVYEVSRTHNVNYATGEMISSVQTGARALPASCAAFFLVLGDQPAVRLETLTALASAWRNSDAPLVVPTHGGKRGHPVLFSGPRAPEILALPADATLKTLVTRHAARVWEVPVPDAAVLADIDTPEDYARALQEWQSRSLG